MIQIYGAGIAGTYLYNLLSINGYNVKIFDIRSEPDCRCAWGIVYREAKKFYSEIGVNFDDYVLVKPQYVVANGIWLKNKGIVIFDKKRLLSDMWVELNIADDPETVVDATGTSRAFLPPIRGDRVLPLAQNIEKHGEEENIYIQMDRTGYAWAFPLGDGHWHIGAGSVDRARISYLIKNLRKKYGFYKEEKLCNCSAKIRMLRISECRPFICGKTVGVGEAIGCVSGSGEGNIPSLTSARILYECIVSGKIAEYEDKILNELEWVEIEQRFAESMFKGKFLSAVRLLPKIISIESKRTVDHSVGDIRKILGI